MSDADQVLKDFEDHLAPKFKLDLLERALYYHLFRHTRLIGKDSGLFPLGPLASAIGTSDTAVRERIRALDQKGIIQIQDRTRSGHIIAVHLPGEINGVLPEALSAVPIDLEALDFYSNRTYVAAILARENGRCFYCLRTLQAETCALDHVVPSVMDGGNSYRNVVASCHECNSVKQGQVPEAFIRTRYRQGILSTAELEDRLSAIQRLQGGELVPEL